MADGLVAQLRDAEEPVRLNAVALLTQQVNEAFRVKMIEGLPQLNTKVFAHEKFKEEWGSSHRKYDQGRPS